MRVDVIDSFDTLVQLKDDWDSVYAADPEAQFFMSWTWISGWFRRLGSQWLVLAAKESAEADNYVGFFPLQLRTELGKSGAFQSELRVGGGYSTGYNGLICIPRLEAQILHAFAEHAKSMNWAKFHLDNIFLSPQRLELLLGELSTPGFAVTKVVRPDDGDGIDHDIYVHVNLPDDWEAFLDGQLGPKIRRDARWILRQIDDETTDYRVTNVSAQTLDKDLNILLGFWKGQWEEKLASRYHPGLPQAMMKNFRNMIPYCFESGSLFLPILWKGTHPVAAQASLVDRKNKCLIGLITGRDMAVKKPSPSFAIHVYHLRWAIQNGLNNYDLQTGNFAYKYHFGGVERRVECFLASTVGGGHGALERRSLPVVLARAKAFYRAGNLDAAVRACRQILGADPINSEAVQLLEQVDTERRSLLPRNLSTAARLHQAGNLIEAERIYREILDIEPRRFDVRYLLGAIFLQQHRYNEAEQQIGMAVEIRPDVPAAHYNRGLALAKLDQTKDALVSLEKCIGLEPNHSQALTLRAALANSSRDISGAAS